MLDVNYFMSVIIVDFIIDCLINRYTLNFNHTTVQRPCYKLGIEEQDLGRNGSNGKKKNRLYEQHKGLNII